MGKISFWDKQALVIKKISSIVIYEDSTQDQNLLFKVLINLKLDFQGCINTCNIRGLAIYKMVIKESDRLLQKLSIPC